VLILSSLTGEEIKDVHEPGGLGAVHLGKSAAGTDHRRELLVLNIENLREVTAGGPEYSGFKFLVFTF